ncbi:hypothetical protein Tco_0951614 [Tanacetum coccineum]|uniref:Uncharacterized protein n=1 Tax=Tanacetum coccineum TaxID=301880 RepID=A0ABQ5E0M8_9ASTR
MGNVKKFIAERTRHQRQYDKRVKKRQMQTQESKIDMGKALDADLVVTDSSGAELEVLDESSRLGNDTNTDDADIRPMYDEEPMAEIFTGHRFSPNKTSDVYEKTSPRSDLRWKPTGRIFKTAGLRWIPTGKLFDSCTSKADSESTHGFIIWKATTSTEVPTIDMIVMTSMIDLESLFGPLFEEKFNGENQVVSKSSIVTTADASDKRQQQQDSTSSTSTLATTITADAKL